MMKYVSKYELETGEMRPELAYSPSDQQIDTVGLRKSLGELKSKPE